MIRNLISTPIAFSIASVIRNVSLLILLFYLPNINYFYDCFSQTNSIIIPTARLDPLFSSFSQQNEHGKLSQTRKTPLKVSGMLPKSKSDNQKLFSTVKGLTKNNNICKYIKPLPVQNWFGTVKALPRQIIPSTMTQIQLTGSTLSKA